METPVINDFEIERIEELQRLLPTIPLSSEEINEISIRFLPQIKSASLETEVAQARVKVSQSIELPKLVLGGTL